jgi:hypothetical protein
MESDPRPLDVLLKSANRKSQQQCYSVIHLTIGFLLFTSGIVLALAIISGQYMRSVWIAIGFATVWLIMLLSAITDVYATTVCWIITFGLAFANLFLIMIDFKHFFGTCEKDYCSGWQWPVFCVFFVFLFINLIPLVIILYFMWRVWVLEAMEIKLNKPNVLR